MCFVNTVGMYFLFLLLALHSYRFAWTSPGAIPTNCSIAVTVRCLQQFQQVSYAYRRITTPDGSDHIDMDMVSYRCTAKVVSGSTVLQLLYGNKLITLAIICACYKQTTFICSVTTQFGVLQYSSPETIVVVTCISKWKCNVLQSKQCKYYTDDYYKSALKQFIDNN